MNFLFAGTAIVWIAILGYVISLSIRQDRLSKRLKNMEQRTKS